MPALRRLTIAAALTLSFAGSPALAATGNGEFAIKDAGKADCSSFIAAKNSGGEEYGRFSGWLMGYISAYNQVMPETFDIAPWQEMDLLMALMQNFCEKNGDTKYLPAAAGLISIIKPMKLTDKSEPVTARHKGEKVQVYRAIMKRLQKRLKEQGFYASDIDGLYGPGTRRAIIAFQRQEGVPETGVPDQVTLYRALMPRG